jgi:hypothetical protein
MTRRIPRVSAEIRTIKPPVEHSLELEVAILESAPEIEIIEEQIEYDEVEVEMDELEQGQPGTEQVSAAVELPKQQSTSALVVPPPPTMPAPVPPIVDAKEGPARPPARPPPLPSASPDSLDAGDEEPATAATVAAPVSTPS